MYIQTGLTGKNFRKLTFKDITRWEVRERERERTLSRLTTPVNIQCSDALFRKSRKITTVRIRVRIDSPHPLVYRKRRLNGAVLQMRPEKPRPRVTAGVAR
jgi:hypothetical protein